MTTLTKHHETLTAVPFLIGYHPSDSIVIVAMRGDQAGMAMRIDFPTEPAHELVEILIGHLRKEGADSALLAAYVDDCHIGSDEIVEGVAVQLVANGIHLRDCIMVKDKEFTVELLRSMSEVGAIDYEEPDHTALQREGALALIDLVDEFSRKGTRSKVELVAKVLARLADLHIRDYGMGMVTQENRQTLLSLWRWLGAIAPRSFAAAPWTLYAELLYEMGESAGAIRALDHAFEDDPQYPLATLLQRAFNAKWEPERFMQMREELHPKICEFLFPH
jgi:tetratricopeptide (TPR) repeat protein